VNQRSIPPNLLSFRHSPLTKEWIQLNKRIWSFLSVPTLASLRLKPRLRCWSFAQKPKLNKRKLPSFYGFCGPLYEWVRDYQAKYTVGFSASVRRQQLLHKRIQKLEPEPSLVKQDLQFLNHNCKNCEPLVVDTADLGSWIIFFFHHQHVQFAKEIPFPLVKFTRRENPGLKNNRWWVDITTNRSMLLVPYICIIFFSNIFLKPPVKGLTDLLTLYKGCNGLGGGHQPG